MSVPNKHPRGSRDDPTPEHSIELRDTGGSPGHLETGDLRKRRGLGEREIGDLIARAMERVGKEGVRTVH